MNRITVLLTGTGAPGAPGIIKCLRKNGEREVRIVGVDMNNDAGGKRLVDSFFTVPPADDKRFIDRIKEICIDERVDIIIPIVTKELMKFSKSKSDFRKMGIKVAVMEEKILEITNDKGKLLNALDGSGIPIAEFYIVNTVDQIKDASCKLGYPDKPFCIKPTKGNGSRGVRIIDPSISKYDLFFNSKPNSMYISYDEMILTLSEKRNIPEMIVMEYLPGQEYSVDVLANRGRIVQVLSRINSIVVNGIALECIVENNLDLAKQAIGITKYLLLDGNYGIDFKCNTNNEPRIMEINPRLTAGIVAYAPAGINFPYMGVKQLLGEKIIVNEIQHGVKMIRRWEEMFEDSIGNQIEW